MFREMSCWLPRGYIMVSRELRGMGDEGTKLHLNGPVLSS